MVVVKAMPIRIVYLLFPKKERIVEAVRVFCGEQEENFAVVTVASLNVLTTALIISDIKII